MEHQSVTKATEEEGCRAGLKRKHEDDGDDDELPSKKLVDPQRLWHQAGYGWCECIDDWLCR